MKSLLFIAMVCISTVLIIGCTEKKEQIPVSSDKISTPYQEFDSTTLFSYSGPYKRWRLDADHMRKPLADTGQILVTPVKLTLYDSLGQPESKVLADSGTTDAKLDILIVWGNVYVRTREHMIVKAQKLIWKRNSHQVESDTYVQIETEKGDILRGKGLVASEDFSRSSFKSNVSGSFPDFKKRVEQNDDKFF